MDKDEIERVLINLTENQAKLMKVVLTKGTAASGASGLSGHGLGRVASSLHEKGIITPMGRSGRQYKWSTTPTWEKNWDKFREEISSMLDRITES